MLYNICFYFILFLSYSILGWTAEIISCSILQKKMVINRGFLIGPYCPIYGFSAVLMILFLKKYIDDPIALFIMATVVCTIMEYLTSLIMEKLFNARWWDYSEKKFNLNGRVCLMNSCLFGLLGLLLMYLINPFYTNLLLKIPNVLFMIIGMVLMILFITDCIISIVIISKLKLNARLFVNKDNTEEISKRIKEALSKHRKLSSRVLHAFPRAKSTGEHKVDPFVRMKEFIDSQKAKK